MSILASELIARIVVQGAKEAEAQLSGVGNATDRAGRLLKGALVLGAIGAGAAIIGLGIKATKMAADFQTSMTQLVTGAGESQHNLAMVSDGILKMAIQTGTATDQLSAGMYMIESAGFHGARGLDILRAAAEGAKVGNAQLADVANGVTTIMTDYANTGITAAQATNILIAAVAAGKTHMQDMSTAMATILPTSSAVGVSMRDTAAAMATMTGEGTNAAAAATYLKQLLLALEAPSSGAAKALKEVGLSTAQVATAMHQSLPDALKLITDRLAQVYGKDSPAYVDALKKIAGGSRQMQGILELTGTHLKTFSDNVNNITDAVNKGGKAITGWNLVQQDFNFKLDQAKAGLEVLGITIGTKLLPILTPLIGKFADWASNLALAASHTDFSGLAKGLQTVATFIGDAAQNAGDFIGWLSQVGNYVINSQAWKDTATNIGAAAQNLGDFVASMKQQLSDPSSQDFMKNVAEGAGQVGSAITDIIDHTTALLSNFGRALDGTQYTASTVEEAVFQLNGTIDKGSLSVKDAIGLVNLGYVSVKDNITGATINLKEFIKNGGKMPEMAKQVSLLDQQWHAWLDYIKNGGTQSFDAFRAADNKATQNFLQNQAKMHPSLAQTKKKLEELNQGFSSNQAASNKATAAFLADQARMRGDVSVTRKKLEELNGPFTPKVNLSNIYLAITEANAAYWAFQRLNGTSRWTAYLQQVTIGAPSPLGGPRAHASGIMNNPRSHWAMVGEQGPELMYVPQGASIYPHGQSMNMTHGNQPIQVNVYLDGAPVAKKLMPHIVQNIRTSVGVRI